MVVKIHPLNNTLTRFQIIQTFLLIKYILKNSNLNKSTQSITTEITNQNLSWALALWDTPTISHIHSNENDKIGPWESIPLPKHTITNRDNSAFKRPINTNGNKNDKRGRSWIANQISGNKNVINRNSINKPKDVKIRNKVNKTQLRKLSKNRYPININPKMYKFSMNKI